MTARLVYAMNVSVDGFINDARGSLDWSVVDDELHAWFNEHERRAAAFIYGRRVYETMAVYWPFALDDPEATDVMREFARIWQPKPKFVFSTTLESVSWNSQQLVGDVVTEVERLKSEIEGELHIAGATVAAPVVRAGLVDEFVLIVHPAVLGGGTPFFPDGARPAAVRLVETRTFAHEQVLLRYVPR